MVEHYEKSKLKSITKTAKMDARLFSLYALRSRTIPIVDEGEEDHE
jgi:hypothetical protein